ncbi:MAG: NUDIX domain-containing protein [Tissierellia bacterium]|nr:NUDIX domain-containing protein [Tissierellia bacterium]
MDKKMVVIVKGIVLFNNKALILKRSEKDRINPGKWEFVGGKINFNEELEDALKREIKEEASIDIEVDDILYATNYRTSPTRNDVVIVYKCHAISDKVKLSKEHSDYKWVTEAELEKYIYEQLAADLKKYNAISKIFS